MKTGSIFLLFTKVATPPQNELTGPQTSVWHFGWNTGGGLMSTRDKIVDHWAVSTANLDQTVARLKSENVKFLDEIRPWGNSRAAMIEGPDRIAIEIVEIK